MPQKVIQTNRIDAGLLLVRVGLGCVIFAHGAQKLLGAFEGHGPTWTVEKWQEWFGFHPAIIWLVILGEFFAPLALIAGLFTRYMAGVIMLIMLGAIYFVHSSSGFFMNWYAEADRGEGFEYHILVLTMCVCIIFTGPGNFSWDAANKKSRRSI